MVRLTRLSSSRLVAALVAFGTVAACNAIFGVDELAFDGAGGATTSGDAGGGTTSSSGTGGGGGMGGSGGTGVGGGLGGAGGALPDPTGTPLWSVALVGNGDDVGKAIAVDPAGDVIVAGTFVTLLTTGAEELNGAGSVDVFVAKLNGQTGAVLWARGFTGDYQDEVAAVAVDEQGDVAVIGSFRGNLTIGGDQYSTGNYTSSAYLAKLDGASGAVLRSAAYGSIGYAQVGQDVAFDGSGAILVTGHFADEISFDPPDVLPSAGAEDIFLAKLDGTDFSVVWQKSWGASGTQAAQALALNGQGQMWLGGLFDGAFTIEQHNLPVTLGNDLFLVKLNATGNPTWHLAVGGAARQQIIDLAVGPAGVLWACGGTQDDVDLGGGLLPWAGGSGDDVIVMKRTPSGTHVYGVVAGDGVDQDCRGIAADLAGNAVVTGELSGAIDFGGGPLVSAGGDDIFVAKLGPQGDHLWSYRFGDAAPQNGQAVATGPDGSVFVTGTFEQGVTFDNLSPLTGGNNEEVFVVKLAY